MTVRRSEPPPPSGRVRMMMDTGTHKEINDWFALVHAPPLLCMRMDIQPRVWKKALRKFCVCLRIRTWTRPAWFSGDQAEFMGAAPRVIESAAADHLLERALAETPPPCMCGGHWSPTNVASALLKAHWKGLTWRSGCV